MEQKIKKWKRSFKYTLTCPLYTTEHMESMARIAMIINTESQERKRKKGFNSRIQRHFTHLLCKITKNEKLADSY